MRCSIRSDPILTQSVTQSHRDPSMEIMYDPCEKGSSDWCGEISSEESHATTTTATKKTCADCGTTKTPLWRGGPAGPKSLCNACGIRSRKKRRAMINAGAAEEKKRPKKTTSSGSGSGSSSSDRSNNKYGEWLKEILMQKKRSSFERQQLQLGEEEQAAVLLMALSYGSVYA